MDKALKFACGSLALNVAFSAYYFVSGIISHSWWLLTLATYYFLLSAVRFVVLRTKGKDKFVMRLTGSMLMVLSWPLATTVVLAVMRDRGHKFHTVMMIALATYAFAKISLATINFIKVRQRNSGRLVSLRYISFADAFVSIFALQRSMLVTFEGMTESEILVMNMITGASVCGIVFLLGLHLLINKVYK